MRTSERRAGAASRRRRGTSIAVLATALGGAMAVNGCPSSGPEASHTTVDRAIDIFRPVDESAARPAARPDPAALLAEALVGTTDAAGPGLGSRMQVRSIRIPKPPRGATSRFNFDGSRRGWITALPSEQILATPAFADGKVFLGGGFASHHFFAFDAYDGELAWTVAAPDGGPTAAIVYENRVIFNTESCTLFVADKDTGTLLWKRWLGDPLMSQAAASEGLVLSAYPANGAHEFAAFRLEDGEPVWKIAIGADIIQAPQVVGSDVYFATMDGTARRVRVRDGHVHWSRDVGASSAIWIDGDSALLTRRAGTAAEPKEEPIVLSTRTGAIERRGALIDAPYLAGGSRDRQMLHGQLGAWGTVPHGDHLGLTNIAAGWAFQGSSPAVADGRAYFAVGSEIRARDIATADEVWTRSYAEAAGAQAVSPPAVVGSQLFFGTVDGHLYAADIDTGMTLWAYDLGEPVVFQPIVAQGWIYVATGRGNLIGLEIGDPRMDGWHMWGGNAQHAGLVETAGTVDPQLLASLERPGQGTMRVAAFETATDAVEGASSSAAPVEPDATDATESTGLAASREEATPDLPLVRTRVQAEVSGFVARVTVTQEFENPHDRPIEALYLFPLPADAAVDDMEMHIGNRVVRGQIKRRAAARETYETARAEGRRAALLEQQRPNLFAQSVANIGAGEQIDVQLTYVQMLPVEDGQYELTYPMVAPPRFDPEDPAAVLGRSGGGAPNEVRVAASVELSVTIDAGLPLRSLASPTHAVDIERPDGSSANVSLARRGEIPNRDFVLRYSVAGDRPQATVLAHRDEDAEGHFSLVVEPPANPDPDHIAPRELTFVVDTSSSMTGIPMQHAQALMRHALRTVRPGDTFNVLSFSDQVHSLAPHPVPHSDANVRDALALIDNLRATGATQMVPAIRQALTATSSSDDDDRLRIVVLLTDGFIGNEADVLRAIATDLGEARVFTVGVGSATNRFLLERAAEIGRGRSTVVTLSEDPQVAGERFAELVAAPVFTDIEVDWGGLQVADVYPRRLPDLFAGKPLVVHGRYGRGGTAEVKVRGTFDGRRYERVVRVTLPDRSADQRHAAHATLWARAAVKDRMNRLYLRADEAIENEIAELGLRYRMVTQYTSFVAVEERREPAADGTSEEPAEDARATVSPARALPGDPEIRIPAPADARQVTVILPFGETLSANYEPELARWTARFLIPADAAEASYPIEVLITHADGRPERLRVWYTVDASAPLLEVEVDGDIVPGGTVTLRARQMLTERDLVQAGLRTDAQITEARAQFLSDARDVRVRLPDGTITELAIAGPGRWEGSFALPPDARGTFEVTLVVVDLAANVATQSVSLEVESR